MVFKLFTLTVAKFLSWQYKNENTLNNLPTTDRVFLLHKARTAREKLLILKWIMWQCASQEMGRDSIKGRLIVRFSSHATQRGDLSSSAHHEENYTVRVTDTIVIYHTSSAWKREISAVIRISGAFFKPNSYYLIHVYRKPPVRYATMRGSKRFNLT